MIRRRWHIALLAIFMAVLTWYLVTGRDLVETWVDFPLEITNPPEGMIIRDGMISHISARLRGPKGLIRNLETKKLAYSLDTGNLEVGENAIDISPANLNLAGAIEVMEVRPPSLKLVVDMYVEKKAEVIPQWEGELDSDYKLLETATEPGDVILRGPASILEDVVKVKTQTIRLDTESPGDWIGEVPLELPGEVESSPAVVQVILDFGVKKRKMWVKVPLYILGPEEIDFEASQNYVRLLVEAPKPFFRKSGFRNDIIASLDLNSTVPEGRNSIPYDVSLPAECSVQKRKPQKLTVTISRRKP